jgi:hypothetical protein
MELKKEGESSPAGRVDAFEEVSLHLVISIYLDLSILSNYRSQPLQSDEEPSSCLVDPKVASKRADFEPHHSLDPSLCRPKRARPTHHPRSPGEEVSFPACCI